jgi:hypothetical protein
LAQNREEGRGISLVFVRFVSIDFPDAAEAHLVADGRIGPTIEQEADPALTAARKQLIRRRFCLANPQKKFPYPRGKNRGFPRLSELAAG